MTEVSGEGYDFLSPEEVVALDRHSAAYGGRAKLAIHSLGRIMGLSDEISTKLAQALSEGIQELGFDERKQIGDHLVAVIEILGGNALQRSVIITPVNETTLNGQSDASEHRGVGAGPGTLAGPGEGSPDADPEAPKVALSREPKYWLGRLYEKEAVNQITNLTQDEFTEFVEALITRYQSLPITKLGKEGKARRAEQLRQFLSGSSVEEIADQYLATQAAMRLGIAKIAESIAKRSTPEEINTLIPGYKQTAGQDGAEEGEDDEADLTEVVQLSPEQLRWFGTLLKDGGVLDAIRQMNEGQRGILINNLSFIFDRATRPSRGNYETDRRLRITREFLKGSSLDAIGETEALSAMAIGDHLIHVRKDIELKVDPTILTRTVYDARDGKDYSTEAAASN